MQLKFKNIAIIGRQHTLGVVETLVALNNYLTSLGVAVVSEKETARLVPDCKLKIVPRERLSNYCELVIVVGGDGSMLSIAALAAKQNLPVLGINRGRLGFLTDIHPDKFDKISEILAGEYREEQRFLLKLELCSNNKVIAIDTVLNDIVLSAEIPGKLIEFSLYIDKNYVCDYRSDGLIVATPTGSTAYALSGGGPILHPDLEAVVVVPMFPHNLSSRPIVIKGTSTIEMKIANTNHGPVAVSADGRDGLMVPLSGIITVHQAEHKLRLIHPTEYDYFATLRSKLNWESQLKNVTH